MLNSCMLTKMNSSADDISKLDSAKESLHSAQTFLRIKIWCHRVEDMLRGSGLADIHEPSESKVLTSALNTIFTGLLG